MLHIGRTLLLNEETLLLTQEGVLHVGENIAPRLADTSFDFTDAPPL